MRIGSLISDSSLDLSQASGCLPLSPFVGKDLLVPYFRHARNPLPSWTQLILDKLSKARSDASADLYAACESMIDCFNEAGLIEVHFGRQGHALTLCRAAIGLTEQVMSQTGRLSAARFAFQPFINEGRLDRISSHWDDAIDKFRRLKAFQDGEHVEIGSVCITQRHLNAIRTESPDFADRMGVNYWIDTVTTLLRAERFSETILLVRASDDVVPEWLADLLLEAAIIALFGLGLPETCLRLAETYLQHLEHSNKAVFLFRRAEILLALNDSDQALKISRALGIALLSSNIPPQHMNLRLVARLGKLLAKFGDENALPVIRIGLAGSECSDDVLSQHEFLSLLKMNCSSASDRSSAQARSDDVLHRSWYGMAHAAAQSTESDERGLIDVLYEGLLALAGSF